MKDVLALIERHQRLAKMLDDGREITFKNERHYCLFAESADVLERLYRALMREHGENEAAAEITSVWDMLNVECQRTARLTQERDAERERCARICDELAAQYYRDGSPNRAVGATDCAAAIRKG